jgi:UTP--glucose-1-phosphate uridylyltransferase
MLPIVDKPMIQYVVEEAVASGLRDVVIVTGRNKRAIEDHFDGAFELEHYLSRRGQLQALRQIRAIAELAEVAYVRQKEPLGLGHAILCARSVVGNEPFAVLLGDDIVVPSSGPCMRQLLDVFARYGGPVLAVEQVPSARVSSYGVIAARSLPGNVYEVLDLVEKPQLGVAPSNLAIVGRYVLTPDLFPLLATLQPDHAGEIQLTAALRALRAHRSIYAVTLQGKRYDTGDRLGFLRATVEFALARPELGPAFRDYLRDLQLRPDRP